MTQGGLGIEKKDLGSIFFFSLTLGGLTNYVIRHTSIYGNVTSFAVTSSAVHTTKDVVPHLF